MNSISARFTVIRVRDGLTYPTRLDAVTSVSRARYRIAIGIVISIASVLGCNSRTESGDKIIQPEQARAALVELVKQKNDRGLIESVKFLETAPIDVIPGEEIAIGNWKCNLKDRTFVVAIDAGPIFAEYAGVFELDGARKWHARITHETHN